jgi:hypothetical protein
MEFLFPQKRQTKSAPEKRPSASQEKLPHEVRNSFDFVRFEFLTVTSMKMAVFWVVAPCSLVEVYRRFRGACCLHHQDNETSVNFYQTTWRNNPENSHLQL